MSVGGDVDKNLDMDSEGFILSVEQKLILLAPITEFMIKKQLSDMGVTRETLTPPKAKKFIDKMTEALQLCLGPEGSILARKMMLKELRVHSPAEEKDII